MDINIHFNFPLKKDTIIINVVFIKIYKIIIQTLVNNFQIEIMEYNSIIYAAETFHK